MAFDLEYNSQAEKLVIPEHGRHVQQLIRHVHKIEDKAERQQFAEQVIRLMHQMNPHNKNVSEYRNRLWKHFFTIAGHEVDVTPPNGLEIEPPKANKRPDRVEYPYHDEKFRHYGLNVKSLIKKAIEMEEGPIKDGFVETIASFMKMAYKNWNREHYVSDEIVLEDLKVMSGGKLSVPENTSLDTLAKAVRNKRRAKPGQGGHSNHRNSRSSNSRHRGRNDHKRRGGGGRR